MEQLMKSYMAIMAERDAAIRERNMALVEKKKAQADRDLAILQRDAAIAQRNSAILERDDAIDALQCRDSSMNGNNLIPGPPGHGMPRGAKHMHQQLQQQHMHHLPHFAEDAYSPREVPFGDDFPNSEVASETAQSRKVKRTKETKAVSSKKSSKFWKKGKRGTKVLSKQVTIAASNGWKNEQDLGDGDEELNRQLGVSEPEWKDDLGLNQVNFDETTMPVPVCSCTGLLQPCYKWGNGGWQSACCTTTLSMYPLPQMPNKRHSRLGGRKMSGSAFTKLLSRLAAEGYDLSAPLDLKDHWAKHGTNRYITIK